MTTRVVRRTEGAGTNRRIVHDIATHENWQDTLAGADTILHLAARTHVIHETESDPVRAYRRVNVAATKRLAIEAVKAGIRRFVFVSSVGVNGNQTNGHAFAEVDDPRPIGSYAQSKLEAEIALSEISRRSSLELVVVRPTLVYGPGAKGNLLRLISLIDRGVPLPLGRIRNRRNLIGLDNLCDFLGLCVEKPEAAGQTFLVAEPEPRSTPEILTVLARGLGKRARLFGVPERVLRLIAGTGGYGSEFERICGSLEVNIDKAQRILCWLPQKSFESQLLATAKWHRERRMAYLSKKPLMSRSSTHV